MKILQRQEGKSSQFKYLFIQSTKPCSSLRVRSWCSFWTQSSFSISLLSIFGKMKGQPGPLLSTIATIREKRSKNQPTIATAAASLSSLIASPASTRIFSILVLGEMSQQRSTSTHLDIHSKYFDKSAYLIPRDSILKAKLIIPATWIVG